MSASSRNAPASLVDLLLHRADSEGARRLFTFLGDEEGEEQPLSYAELDQRARRIAVALRERVPAGERVLLLYPPGLEYVAGFFGCLYAGVVAVPAYPPDPTRLDRTLPRLRAIIQDAQASVVLTTSGILSMAEFIFEQAPDFRELHWMATDELPAGLEAGWSRPEGLAADALAFLQYTSGSTGTPKGVMLSHGNLLHNLGLISHAFRVRPRESVGVIWLPPYHDMGLIGGILEPLFAGIEAAILSPLSFLRRPLRWLEAVSRFRGTISGGPNFAFDLCVRKSTPEQRQQLDLSSWEVAFCGAEPIRVETLDRFTQAFAPHGFRRDAIYPCYGLAEGTLIVTGGTARREPVLHTLDAGALAHNRAVPVRPEAPEARTYIGCGQTLPDQEVLVINPETLEPCAAGQVGELWVSGPSVARGYWRKPAETAHSFQARPAHGGTDRHYLRTGDLGVVASDGEVLITGRLKDLIILRGRNVYPQDLEQTVEQSHPALRPGCGAAFSTEVDGEERLVLVQELDTRLQADLAEVVDAIRQRLSEVHEVQVDAVVLIEPGSISKTSSGKIQRHASRAAFVAGELRAVHAWKRSDAPAKAPARTAPVSRQEPVRAEPPKPGTAAGIEAWLVERLAERLKVARAHVDPHVPITRHGLDSLAAVELSHDIEQGLGVPLQMELLLQGPTLSQLAWQLFTLKSMLKPAAPAPAAPPRSAPTRRELPLTSVQQRLWFFEQRDPGSPLYNIPGALRLEGRLHLQALEQSFEELIRRHEVLRTTFESRDGQPVQVVSPEGRLRIEVVELETWPEASRPQEALRRATEEARRPFDVSRGPLLRATLIRLGAQDHLLVATMHHIISDGWSMGVLLRELGVLYGAFSAGRPSPLPLLPLQYGDHALWQRDGLQGDVLDAQLAWWREQLAGAPPALELPTDRPRPAVQTYQGATRPVRLSGALSKALKDLCQREGVTPFMLLLAGFQALLHRHSGQEDLSVGTAIAGRSRAELRELIGPFFNLVVLRARLSGDLTFRELLGRVREMALGAYAHQETPFEKLVEVLRPQRSQRHLPLFQVLFVLQGEVGTPQLPGLGSRLVELHTGVAPYELSLSLNDTAEGFTGSLEYNRDLFEATTVDRMVGHLRTLLEGIVAAPDRRLSELPLLTDSERRQVLTDWNQTRADFNREASVPGVFREQVRRTPDAVAVRYQDASLTYGELDLRSSQLAARLRAVGVGPDVRVGLCVERSLDMVVGLLGVLKAGGAYVPLDPSYPRERLALMLEDSGAPVLVTQRRLTDLLPHGGAVVCVDALEESTGEARVDLQGGARPDNAAYVIYTSGSTGRPKGVVVQHRNVLNFFAAMDARLDVAAPGVWLAVTSISFDISVLELLWTLSRGFQVVVAGTGVDGLAEQLVRHQVTHLQCTPSLARALMLEPTARKALSTLRQWMVGGEALPPALAAELTRVVPSVLNMYGPTETTVWSSTHRVDASGGPVPIGRPIANTQLYILDALLEPVPVGVAGELYIGGEGVVRGYLGRPDLTAERFIPDPFSTKPGARLYRTGDVACWRADGTVEYLGRADFQVKVRGFRIELGEIEAVLGQHPSVAQAVVVAREDGGGDKWLVAYAVPRPRQTLDAGALRAFAKQRLPGYMVPSVFIPLEALPLTPNGKVDRKALPAPEGSRVEEARPYVAPRTPTEERIAATWGALLGVERVGIHDDFFELGGHSLLATQVISRVRTELGVELPLRALFEAPTVEAFAKRIEMQERSDSLPLTRVPREGALPLSFAQQRLWFLDQFQPGDASYNLAAAIRMEGALDVESLRRAFEELVRRHEALRTTFSTHQGSPQQLIHPPHAWSLSAVDLTAMPAQERETQARELALQDAQRPFSLSTGPLLRTQLVKLGDREHLLLLCMHHIVSDGWSIGVLVREVAALYEAFLQGQSSPLPELPVQYADYAAWQRQWLQGPVLDAQLDYWRQQLQGAPTLELPTDKPRPAVRGVAGASLGFTFPRTLVEGLKALAHQEGASLFMALLASWQVLLSRYSGQTDLSIGSPIAGRTHAETEPLIGFFVNTLVLRARVDGGEDFRALLRQVRGTVLQAYEYQAVPFEKLVETLQPGRSLSHTPLFQSLLALQNVPMGQMRLPHLTLSPLEFEGRTAKFDLSLVFTETPEGLSGTLEYSTELFEARTPARLVGHFQRLLEGIIAMPAQPLATLPLLSDEERHTLLVQWNATDSGHPLDRCVHELFEEQAACTPEATALVAGDARITYRELSRRSRVLAAHLQSLGVGPESVVGLFLERSADTVICLLGILQAGATYLPLDQNAPRDRLAYMLEDARVRLLLTSSALLPRLPDTAARVVCLDTQAAAIAACAPALPAPGASSAQLAYINYTSGSTGRPKGVGLPHRGVVRLALASNYIHLTPDDVVLQVNAVSFDAATFEIWSALLNGATVAVADAGALSLEALGHQLRRHRVTTVLLTASLFTQMVDHHLDALQGLRFLLAGGDVVSPVHARRLRQQLPQCQLINAYGPTENTTITCCEPVKELREGASSVPVGRPIDDTQVYLLDEHLQPVPVGVAGALYTGGAGLARGYLHNPALTAERFIPDPFGPAGSRMYRTGDLARYLPDGRVEFLGRIDQQVKLRGFRIELGEIEAALCQHEAVKDAVVVVRGEGSDKRLVGYVVPRPGPALEQDALKQSLRRALPEYMVPSTFVWLEALPLTAHGKVDRKALPAPEATDSSRQYVAPRTQAEAKLAALMAEVLRLPRVGVHDDFFELGGHSLLATQVVSRVRAELGVELPLRALFEAPTVEALAKRVATEERSDALPLIRVPREGALPLSFAQQRLWFLDRLRPGDASYNISAALRIEGALDVESLRRAFEELVRRHEALRTTFSTHQGSPQQLIHPPHAWSLPAVDLTAVPAQEREAQARELALQEAQRPFSLSTGPLLRTQLLKLGDREHLLLLGMHHIVADGWSMGVLVREVAALYEAFTQGRPSPLPELPVQYADFAAWQRQWLQGPVLDAQLDYWRQQLQGAPILELPTDKPRPALQSHRGHFVSFRIPAPTVAGLNQLAHESGSTLFMVLMAAWQSLLGRYSGQDDICVGTPIANRTRNETEPLIGFFINSLVLRTRLDGDPTFVQLLARVNEASLAAFAHQDVPFEQLVDALGVERDLSRMPLFQVMFALQNAPMQAPTLSSLRVEPVPVHTGASKFDFVLEMNMEDGALSAHLEYCVDLFEHASVERLTRHFHSLLDGIAANPHRPLSQLPPEAPLELPPLRQQAPRPGQGAPIAFVAPRTPVEESLAAIWTEVLEVPTPGVHDSFFSMGGSSLFSIVMLARVQETLGVEIAPKRFFEAPTIAALAAALQPAASASPEESPGASPLVLLNAGGTLPPLFCVHPVGGDVFCYAELARRIDPDQPFYGVRAQGLDGTQEPGQSIDAMARFYLDNIRQVQPSGPYRLMGWSMGGDIAWEMARQLKARGEEVEFLALIDAHAHPGMLLPPGSNLGEVVKDLLAFELQQFAGHLDDHPRLVALRKLLEHHLRALSVYAPGPYAGDVVLLQATEVFDPVIQEQDNGWRPLTSGGLQVHRIPGTHHTILAPPNVDLLAQQLRACLRQLPLGRSGALGDRQAS